MVADVRIEMVVFPIFADIQSISEVSAICAVVHNLFLVHSWRTWYFLGPGLEMLSLA